MGTYLNPGEFVQYTGFLEDEVKKLCNNNQICFEQMKQWYDGYTFSDVCSIYNPYSVMNAVEERKFTSYWRKTSAAESLLTYIDMDEEGLQEDIVRLIGGERIRVNVEGFENDVETFYNKDDVLTLMIHLGYLTYEEDGVDTGIARIPNEEIRMEFHKLLRRAKHQKRMELVHESDELLNNTIQGNAAFVADAVARVHDAHYSPTFYNNEQALRSVIRMAYISCIDQYSKVEETPSGHGLADIVFLPKNRSLLPAIILELKWNKTAESALRQMKDRNYSAVFAGYTGEILLVGINYDAVTKQHTCVIEKRDI